MRLIKYIWLYLTDPAFRFYQEFYARQEMADLMHSQLSLKIQMQNMMFFRAGDPGPIGHLINPGKVHGQGPK